MIDIFDFSLSLLLPFFYCSSNSLHLIDIVTDSVDRKCLPISAEVITRYRY